MTEPPEVSVDTEKARKWLDQGAKPSNTVRSLLEKAGM
jgi:small subunit ribosomal protein S16